MATTDHPEPTDLRVAKPAQVEAAQVDPQAFAPLYERHAGTVWRFAMSRVGDPDRAHDVTSQTFARALTALPSPHTRQPRREKRRTCPAGSAVTPFV